MNISFDIHVNQPKDTTQIDPMDFNEKCDGSLPLEEMIKPDPSIRKLFEDIDRKKVCLPQRCNSYVDRSCRLASGL